MSNRLGGKQGTAYTGTNANQPPNWTFAERDPNLYDFNNVALGDLWLNTANEEIWVLVSLDGDTTSRGRLAHWVQFGGGIETLTGNSGGAVGPDANDNVNVIGDTTTINVAGNTATNTLTISAVGTGVLSSLTGDSGGAVSPTAGNINTLGTVGHISVTGNPGTSTLTWDLDATIADVYTANTGFAVPALNNLNILGSANQITTSGAASTITVALDQTTTGLFKQSAFAADISANILNVTGAGTVYTILFNRTYFNIGSNFNTGTGIYTAPSAGLYHFSTTVTMTDITAAMTAGLVGFFVLGTGPSAGTWQLFRDNAAATVSIGAAAFWRYNGSVTVSLATGDQVYVNVMLENGAGDTADVSIGSGGGAAASTTWFTGYKITGY